MVIDDVAQFAQDGNKSIMMKTAEKENIPKERKKENTTSF